MTFNADNVKLVSCYAASNLASAEIKKKIKTILTEKCMHLTKTCVKHDTERMAFWETPGI